MNAPEPTHAVARLLRPGSAHRVSDVPNEAREHAATVVAHLLHEECREWSWTEHHPETHRAEARRIVGALCREGWGPPRPDDRSESDGCGRATGAA